MMCSFEIPCSRMSTTGFVLLFLPCNGHPKTGHDVGFFIFLFFPSFLSNSSMSLDEISFNKSYFSSCIFCLHQVCGALRSTGTSTSISSETTDGASKHLSFQTLLLSATGSFRTTTSSIDDVINRPRVRISYMHLLWSWINFALLTHLCQSLLVRYVTFTFLSKSLFSS